MAVDVRRFLKDRKVWLAGAAGSGIGLYVYLRRRRRQMGAGATTETGQPINPATGAAADSGAVDAYNNLQGELENLQGQITALYGGAPLPTAQQAVAPTTPSPKTGTWTMQLHRIGVVGKTYNLRDIARRFASNPSSADSVEAELHRIVQANPSLKGRTTLPGGFALQTPVYKAP